MLDLNTPRIQSVRGEVLQIERYYGLGTTLHGRSQHVPVPRVVCHCRHKGLNIANASRRKSSLNFVQEVLNLSAGQAEVWAEKCPSRLVDDLRRPPRQVGCRLLGLAQKGITNAGIDQHTSVENCLVVGHSSGR